ncbi:hypothetical protein PR048_018205 [Dryococelus australis]|uniref:alkaline phosphatase n=1 Tax=Dryococelus australis TaxID=614101 RepID=A0ABQ9HBS6_9NEOP|nr:hypothetical protein PR048_018205 [Dryococelus australis]
MTEVVDEDLTISQESTQATPYTVVVDLPYVTCRYDWTSVGRTAPACHHGLVSTGTACNTLSTKRADRHADAHLQNNCTERVLCDVCLQTYNSDAQVGDSAACATALLCGVKANYGTLGMSGANFNQCDSSGEPVPSMLSWAQDEGLATGIVTNTRLSHATPAALYAHAHSRYWEDDSKVPVHWRAACKDIARQLVDDSPGSDINVSSLASLSLFLCLSFSHCFVTI